MAKKEGLLRKVWLSIKLSWNKFGKSVTEWPGIPDLCLLQLWTVLVNSEWVELLLWCFTAASGCLLYNKGYNAMLELEYLLFNSLAVENIIQLEREWECVLSLNTVEYFLCPFCPFSVFHFLQPWKTKKIIIICRLMVSKMSPLFGDIFEDLCVYKLGKTIWLSWSFYIWSLILLQDIMEDIIFKVNKYNIF